MMHQTGIVRKCGFSQFYFDSRAAPAVVVCIIIHVLYRYRRCIRHVRHTITICNHSTHAFTYLFPWEYVITVADSSVNRSVLAEEPFRDMGIIYSPLGQRNSVFSQQKFPVFRSTGHLASWVKRHIETAVNNVANCTWSRK
jgi:hypothetical protein